MISKRLEISGRTLAGWASEESVEGRGRGSIDLRLQIGGRRILTCPDARAKAVPEMQIRLRHLNLKGWETVSEEGGGANFFYGKTKEVETIETVLVLPRSCETKIGVMLQTPVLFTVTIRFNMDPLGCN